MQVVEQVVVAGARLRLGDPAGRVRDVAEADRFGRAGLLARGDDVAVGQAPAVLLGVDLGPADSLDAVRALLHDAPGTDRDVRVLAQLHHLGRVLGEVEVVEAPHLVGTVVRAVAGADATVVDHRVQPFAVVHGGRDRADLLAGCVLALHAGHRLEARLRLGGEVLDEVPEHAGGLSLVGEVAVDAEPVHLPALHHLLLADDRHVVLALAGDHAGVAADAGVQVDRHAPLRRVLVGPLVPHRVLVRFLAVSGREVGMFLEVVEVRFADDRAPLHRVVVLGLRQRVGATGRAERAAGEMWRFRGA